MAGIEGLKTGGAGGGVRPNATATPNVRPKITASTSANLISGPRAPRIRLQGGDAPPSLKPADHAERAQRRRLGQDQPAVDRYPTNRRFHADQGVDHTAQRHGHEAPGRRVEPTRGQIGMLTAAQGVDQQRQ